MGPRAGPDRSGKSPPTVQPVVSRYNDYTTGPTDTGYITEKIGHWKLKEGALDHTLWRNRFGRSYGPVI